MVGTNVNISEKAQKLLIKAAAERKVSVETLASEILNEGIQNKFAKINTSELVEKKHSPNPLTGMQPYAYSVDPEQPAIPLEDWNMENYDNEIE